MTYTERVISFGHFTPKEETLIYHLELEPGKQPDWLEIRLKAEELGITVDFPSFERKLEEAIKKARYTKENLIREIAEFLEYAKRELLKTKSRLAGKELGEIEKRKLEECESIIAFVSKEILQKAKDLNPNSLEEIKDLYNEFEIEKYDFLEFVDELLEE